MADDAISQDELVRRTQELFDAVVPGNAEPWKKYFADDCIFSDEKGRTLDKAALVADIAPLPRGYSGTIKIAKLQSIIHGDTAILSYDLDETETVFGQNLTARYHGTDTWLRRNGTWQIVASQAMRYYEDPAVGKADPKKFADFVGTYELALDKPEPFPPRAKSCTSSEKANASNSCPRVRISFSVTAWRAAFCFATPMTERSMLSSIVGTTKTSSGAKQSKYSRGHAAEKEANQSIGDETGKFSTKAKGAFVFERALIFLMVVSRILSASS